MFHVTNTPNTLAKFVQTRRSREYARARTAYAIAEGIELALTQSQFVTVPILDARLAQLRAELGTEIERSKSELVRWVFLVMLGDVALSTGATALLNWLQHLH